METNWTCLPTSSTKERWSSSSSRSQFSQFLIAKPQQSSKARNSALPSISLWIMSRDIQEWVSTSLEVFCTYSSKRKSESLEKWIMFWIRTINKMWPVTNAKLQVILTVLLYSGCGKLWVRAEAAWEEWNGESKDLSAISQKLILPGANLWSSEFIYFLCLPPWILLIASFLC